MYWLEQKYIGLLSSRLRNYKRKSNTLYNFSCIFCGDSHSDSKKARGYLYEKKGKVLYHCHNCNVTYGFEKFLKEIDSLLHSEYSLEKLKDTKPLKDPELEIFINKMRTPIYLQSGPLKGLKKVSQLQPSHPCKVFVKNRMIPNPYHAKMFFIPKFMTWANEIIPNKFDDEALLYDEPRLLIPFFNSENMMHAFQGRSLDSKSKTRYITIVNDESTPKVYGLDTIDFNKKVYCFEGPIDSMFIPNSIATAGGDLVSTIKDFPKKNIVVVYDNERFSKDTVNKIDKAIMNGYNVCIWPTNFDQKDVNDAILAGLSSEFIKHIIDTNTYRDLAAKLALNYWKRA